MKTNIFSKVAVTMMTVALGAGIVGSISGTVAWFQYSTRSTVAYTGTAAHSTENLQIRVFKDGQAADAGWKQDILSTEINALIKEQAEVQARILKKTGITAVSVDDASKVKANTTGLPAGYSTFVFDGTNWKIGSENADLAALGLSVTGTPANGDTFQVAYNDGTILAPVTSGELALGEFPSILHKDPIYQYAETSSWGLANSIDYVDIPLEFRVQDVDGNADATKRALLAKKVYLSDLTIAAKDVSGKKDITKAVRFAITDTSADHDVRISGATTSDKEALKTALGDIIGAYTFVYVVPEAPGVAHWELGGVEKDLGDYSIDAPASSVAGDKIVVNIVAPGRTFSAEGADTDVYGNLDLNNDTHPDQTPHYDWDTEHPATTIVYGDNGKVAKSNDARVKATDASTFDIADDSDPYNIKGKELGTTIAAADGSAATEWLKLNLRVYLEGWQQLGTTPSALWSDADYVGSQFNIGLRFTAEAHVAH